MAVFAESVVQQALRLYVLALNDKGATQSREVAKDGGIGQWLFSVNQYR